MNIDFKSLKKNSQQQLENLKAYTEKLNKQGGNNSEQDDLFWYPALDKAGNGYAIIRFLPAPAVDGDDGVPYIKMFTHGFEGENGWFIEKSLTTIGKPCPVAEFNTKLWKQSEDDNSPSRKQARKQKRKLQYYMNVYIVEDTANPENNGKVKLFKAGKKIFDKIEEQMYPEKTFPENYKGKIPEAVNPFDLWTGKNFELRIRKVDGNVNYDNSKFLEAGPLLDSDAELKVVWESEHSLQKFLQPDQFLSYDEMKEKLYKVLGLTDSSSRAEREEIEEKADFGKKLKESPAKQFKSASSDEDDEFDEDWLKKLKEDQ